MRIESTLNIAFRALRRNKMRSVLTALGIIIGVAAVIAMVGIGNGAKAQVEAQIASLGQNVILIFSGSTTSSGIRTGWGGAGTLKIEDADAILDLEIGILAKLLDLPDEVAGHSFADQIVAQLGRERDLQAAVLRRHPTGRVLGGDEHVAW